MRNTTDVARIVGLWHLTKNITILDELTTPWEFVLADRLTEPGPVKSDLYKYLHTRFQCSPPETREEPTVLHKHRVVKPKPAYVRGRRLYGK